MVATVSVTTMLVIIRAEELFLLTDHQIWNRFFQCGHVLVRYNLPRPIPPSSLEMLGSFQREWVIVLRHEHLTNTSS